MEWSLRQWDPLERDEGSENPMSMTFIDNGCEGFPAVYQAFRDANTINGVSFSDSWSLIGTLFLAFCPVLTSRVNLPAMVIVLNEYLYNYGRARETIRCILLLPFSKITGANALNRAIALHLNFFLYAPMFQPCGASYCIHD